MEYQNMESTEQIRQFLGNLLDTEDKVEEGRRRNSSSSSESRVKISNSSLNRALHRVSFGERSIKLGGKEKKVRRQIANSNERKRMQSINDGFQALKALLPQTDTGEKLSKATVLQHAANYIAALLDERKRLLAINTQCMLLIGRQNAAVSATTLAPPQTPVNSHKRRKSVTESSDEGISLTTCDYKPSSRSRGKEYHLAAEVSRGSTERGNKRLKRVTEEQHTSVTAEPVCTSKPPSLIVTSTLNDAGKFGEIRSEDYRLSTSQAKSEAPKSMVLPGALKENIDVKVEQTVDCPNVSSDCSVSRRNLATIVMAIRHLEGKVFLSDVDDLEANAAGKGKSDERPVEVGSTSTAEHLGSGNCGEKNVVAVPEKCESLAVKRRWQNKWETGCEKGTDSNTKAEGVMKLKDRLLRKRQMEMEQQQQLQQQQTCQRVDDGIIQQKQLHKQQQLREQLQQLQQLEGSTPLTLGSRQLLKHLMSSSNEIRSETEPLAACLQNKTFAATTSDDISAEKITAINEKLFSVPLISNSRTMSTDSFKAGLSVVPEYTENVSNCFPFYYTDQIVNSACRPVVLNTVISDKLSLNNVSFSTS